MRVLSHSLTAPLCLIASMLGLSTAVATTDFYSTGPGQGTNDGLSDVWQAIYNAWGLNSNGDEDFDGCSNKVESDAGTDPRNPADCHHVGNAGIVANEVIISFEAEAGKKYRVLSHSLPTGVFSVEEDLKKINGATQAAGVKQFIPNVDSSETVPTTLSVTKSGELRFFRLDVSDADTDSDGVSDWEEREAGLNPELADSDGDGVLDGQVIMAEVSEPDIVSIAATTSIAFEDGPQAGTFTVSRTRSLLPATVNFSLAGTASGGDFGANPGSSVTFVAGEKTKLIQINPSSDSTLEGSESVTATLTTASAGTYAAPVIDPDHDEATVIIQNSTATSGTGLTARYYDNASSIYSHAANFGDVGNYAYTRSGSSPNYTGVVVVTPTGVTAERLATLLAALTPSTTQVKLSFSGGNLNNITYNDQSYLVTAKTATTFTCTMPPGATLPATSSSTCGFSILPLHPPVIDRVDATVDVEWGGGTPNGNSISPLNSPDNWSSAWDGYLHPTTAGNYRFQLDADDKARVLLDLNGNGIFELPVEQVLEHGWDTAATGSPEDGTPDDEILGTFKISATHALVVPASAALRYKIRVEQVETTGDARCRLQWSLNNATFANIPQANVFSHVAAMNANYNYTRTVSTAGAMQGTILVTLNGHGYAVSDSVELSFSSGNLFTPANGNFHGTYTVAVVNSANTFTVNIAAPTLPASNTGAGYVLNRPTSTNPTNAWYNVVWQNTTFSGAPGRIGTNNNGTNDSNNGIYGSGTPDINLIGVDTYTVRWSGQIQPQFTDEYTLSLLADEGCTLKINGAIQELKILGSVNNGGSTYYYDGASGNTITYYANSNLKLGSVIPGETMRLDPANGNLNLGANSTYTYDSASGNLVVDYSNLTNVNSGGFVVGEIIEVDPTSGSVNLGQLPYTITAATPTTFTVNIGVDVFLSGSGNINVSDVSDRPVTAAYAAGLGTYTYTSTTGNTVVNFSLLGFPAGTFQAGDTVLLDPTGGNLSAQNFAYKTIASATATTFTVSYPTGSGDSTSTIAMVATNTTATIPVGLTGAFVINFGPGKHANASVGSMNFNFANKPLKDWASNGNERFVRIPMIAGTRYDIEIDYWENGGFSRNRLFWFSPSQPKQIVPTERLYPTMAGGLPQPLAPSAHVSSTEATVLVGGLFSYAVLGSNGASVSVSGNPAWLNFSNGVLSGTPPSGAAGNFQVLITLTNAAGTSTSVLNVHVEDTGGGVERELWTGIGGTAISSIPLGAVPTSTSNLTSLTALTDAADDFGARIRGYITAPVTGNYYFWLSASESAEFWLSNDHDTVNSFKRSTVTGGGATPLNWATAAKSPWMALEQGKRYYFEILHKSGIGSDHLALGWSKPGEATTVPSQVVPGYVLSPYEPPAAGSTPGTLYVATLLRQNGAIDPPGGTLKGVGTATLRLNEAETVATISFSYSGLSAELTDWHVHSDPFLAAPSMIIYDGVEPTEIGDGPQPDGTHKWTIMPVGALSADNIRELIKQGKAYINLHTALNPNGEIRGNYTLANGSRTFSPPPAPPAWTDDSNTDVGAARFLAQASFGASTADITALKAIVPTGGKTRYEMWIEDQFGKTASQSLPEVLRTRRADVQGGMYDEPLFFNSWWRNSISGADQLRQRVAFALSQIHVVSGQGPLDNRAEALAYFYDKLNEGAFGSFREILETTTMTPAMGRYLDMKNNDKPDLTIGRIPNENYAREIKQLFSVGLYRMWPDGTLMLSSSDHPIDTYTQREIVGFAHVFTGWTDGYDGAYRTALGAPANWMRQMREVPARHYTGPKRVLNNEVLPGISTLGGQPLDPIATHLSTHYNQTAYQELPAQELELSHDQLFNHPNTGPFICRQLIQRMVTSHPSRDYLYRVVQKFNDNGSGVRGDMQAVIKAILLDYEARSSSEASKPAYGKQREPLLRVAAAGRAFRSDTYAGNYSQTGTRTITIDTHNGGAPPVSKPHKLASNTNVLLEFTAGAGGPAPFTGTYQATVVDSDTFTIQATGWANGTYSIPANSTVCTVTMTNHWLQSGNQVFMDFTSGTANGTAIDAQVYPITHSSTANNGDNGSSFTITVATTDGTARSGNCMIPRFSPGSYTIAASGLAAPNDRRVTMRTDQDHHLSVGNQVQLNIYGSSLTPAPIDQVVTVDSIVDLRTWTFLISSAVTGYNGTQGYNQVYQFPLLSQPLNRTGTIQSRSSTYQMGATDTDLDQSPVNPDTVFNYFLPDYKFPGLLASQGITTPEFQLTAETGVIRQSNYIYNGIFNPNTSNGLSSFNTGNNALTLDYAPWVVDDATDLGLGAPVNNTVPWTHNQNIALLIDKLSILLTQDQLTGGSNSAKEIIRDLIAMPINSISTGNPCTVTTARAHGYTTGQSVCISGVTNGTFASTVNSTTTARIVTVTGANTFTFPVSCTAAPNASGLTNAHASQIIYNQGSTTPTANERRDRFRAILHLILTSPDFIIQR